MIILSLLAGFSEQASPYLESEDVPFVDYDAYDAQVFNLSSYRTVSQQQQQHQQHW